MAGLIVYETFCYLWTSQVIGNVALATLAGGPYGGGLSSCVFGNVDNVLKRSRMLAWYYFGPKGQGMVCDLKA